MALEAVQEVGMTGGTSQAGKVELTIVYGTNKVLEVAKDDSIDSVKVGAMGLFGIPESEKGNYILRTKVRGSGDEQLDEAKAVEDYHLHNNQKVILASGAPFGACRAS
jgi:hypothetical protein